MNALMVLWWVLPAVAVGCLVLLLLLLDLRTDASTLSVELLLYRRRSVGPTSRWKSPPVLEERRDIGQEVRNIATHHL